MKNFLNKALISKEWKNGKWAMFMFFIAQYCAFTAGYLNDMARLLSNIENNRLAKDVLEYDQKYKHMFYSLFQANSIIPMIILIMGVSFLLVICDRMNNFEYISTMPFSRKEIINTKISIGMLIIVIPSLINYAIITFSYFKNLPIINEYIKLHSLPAFITYSSILKCFALNILIYIFVFTIFMAMFMICGNVYAGAFLGCIVLVFPAGIIGLIGEIFRINMGASYSWQKYRWLSDLGNKICKWITLVGYGSIECSDTRDIIYSNFGLKILILIAVIILLYFAIHYIFKKNNFERTGNILMFKGLEPVLKYGFSICSGLLMACIVPNFIYKTYEYYKTSQIILSDISLVFFSIVFYFLGNKIIKSFRN